ncbi:MAG: histidinol-phosphate transaminase [Bacteroides sp.]|jgi:histidinol-phosphate aminotransferase|nr:histidinol-phosphate transaminase [Bacteroides sp.]
MIENLLRPNIRSLKPYSSARDEFEGEGSVWLDANENPEAPPGLMPGINRYPSPLQPDLRNQISRAKGIDSDRIFIGNGSDEAVDLLFRIFCMPGKDKAMVFPPTYGMYGVCSAVNDVLVIESLLDEHFSINLNDFEEKNKAGSPKLTFICNPNNPTGNVQSPEMIRQIIEESKGIVVVDEAYVDFCPEQSVLPWIDLYPNLVVLQTLSKAWGLAGARIGMAFSSPEIIQVMNRVKFPYNIGKPSIEAAIIALTQTPVIRQRVEEIIEQRGLLSECLSKFPFVEEVFPSSANFLLVKFPESDKIYQYLTGKGIIVRDRSTQPGCAGCLRITIGSETENQTLINALKNF